jgi:hypothetical protein
MILDRQHLGLAAALRIVHGQDRSRCPHVVNVAHVKHHAHPQHTQSFRISKMPVTTQTKLKITEALRLYTQVSQDNGIQANITVKRLPSQLSLANWAFIKVKQVFFDARPAEYMFALSLSGKAEVIPASLAIKIDIIQLFLERVVKVIHL